MLRSARIIVVVLVAAGASAQRASAAGFKVVENEEGLLISEGDQKVLFYQRRPKSLEGRFERANYVHPLYGLDGEILTEDFPKDHLHHRGVFWAWHQIFAGETMLGDSWSIHDFESNVEAVRVLRNEDEGVEIEAQVLWSSPRFKDASGRPIPFVDEQTRIRAHRSLDSQRAIDFEIRLKALVPDVRIGGSDDNKGYGGFSVRIRLPDDLAFTGTRGLVDPQMSAVDAGSWMNMTTETEKQGLAILTHPANPGFPQPWVLRRQRSMQNPAFPGRLPVALSERDPLVLRYRLLLHRGQLDKAALDRAHEEYGRQVP